MSENTVKVLPEIGTLWANGNGDSRFVGSASGVYFLKTVQRAFVNATAKSKTACQDDDKSSQTSTQSQWSAEHIFGSEDEVSTTRASKGTSTRTRLANSHNFFEKPQRLPDRGVAKQLVKVYFETWHPFAPFLHGPNFLAEMDEMLASNGNDEENDNTIVCRNIIFQCVWNLALLDAPDLGPVDGLHDCSPERLIPALGIVALQDTLVSIQALLSAQLLFIATMSLRSASITGGLIVRAIMKAGLHRCPFRYADLAHSDRDMRKRVFWTVYVFDRFLSQALGQPLGIQDSDVDVCSPGRPDLHSAASQRGHQPEDRTHDTSMHLPTTHPNYRPSHRDFQERESTIDSEEISALRTRTEQTSHLAMRRQENQSVLTNAVASSRLLGRALEIFHKSIHVRVASAQEVMLLKVDIETWGNDAVYSWTELNSGDLQTDTGEKLASLKSSIFSIISYHQLLLFINRPSLAAKENTAEFMLALQACLSASRAILQTLRKYINNGGHIFWPGHFLAVWMSGLVIAFACRVEAYDTEQSIIGLTQALVMLKTLSSRWSRAAACHSVLSELLESIRNRRWVMDKSSIDDEAEISSRRSNKKRRRNEEGEVERSSAYDSVLRPQFESTGEHRSDPFTSRAYPGVGSLHTPGPGSSSTLQVQFNQLGGSTSPSTVHAQNDEPYGPRSNAMNQFDDNSSDFPLSGFDHTQWPQIFDTGEITGSGSTGGINFMVWDSLQQLVTSVD